MTRKVILGAVVVTLLVATSGLAAVGSAVATDAGDATTAATSSVPLAQETTEENETDDGMNNETEMGENGTEMQGNESVNATASITFEDQQLNDSSVVVAETNLSEGGFVAVFDQEGTLIGNSSYLESGEHENLTIELNATLDREQVLVASPHLDTNDNETFDFNATEAEQIGPANATDRPYMENDVPVSAVALVSVGNETPERTTAANLAADARWSDS